MTGIVEKGREVVAWFQRNERHLSTPLFVAGFINDIFTTGHMPFSYALYLFGAYIIIAAVSTIIAHGLYVHTAAEGGFLRTARVLLALLAQFVTGGLLSGCLIFYTKDATLTASWPFILLLVSVFVGNEFFRLYRERLAFRAVLFFFTLYAYTIFALPAFIHTIGPATFIESTAVAIGINILFLLGLAWAGWKRFKASFWEIVGGVLFIAAAVNVSYFTGIIPPLPLGIRDIGVYQSVTHTGSEYQLSGEQVVTPWWDIENITPVTVHYVSGTSLSVYSAVFAPISFSTAIIHRWQRYDESTHKWVTQAQIAFPIVGGRDGGYRGYSTLSDLKAGKYRVSVETLSGLVIGRIYFNVVDVTSEPTLITQTK
jgi:hypothetical protein